MWDNCFVLALVYIAIICFLPISNDKWRLQVDSVYVNASEIRPCLKVLWMVYDISQPMQIL